MRVGRKRNNSTRKNGIPASFKRQPETHASIYIVEIEDQAIKIGVSGYVARRVSGLQVGQHRKIVLRWHALMKKEQAYAVEKAIHKYLKGKPCHAKGEIYYLRYETGIKVVEAAIKAMGFDWVRNELARDVPNDGSYSGALSSHDYAGGNAFIY